jgi:ribonucleoside-triphosphate reductase
MADRVELERKLADLKRELDQVEGRPTEVYSRIVGYYRSVRNWNAGKRAEYSRRRTFDMPGLPEAASAEVSEGSRTAPAPARATTPLPRVATPAAQGARPERSGVLVFTRKACPNCPPVADYVTHAGMPAVFVDVDGEEGLALARRHGVLSTPTVVGLDGAGKESFRACGLAELRERLPGFGLGTC